MEKDRTNENREATCSYQFDLVNELSQFVNSILSLYRFKYITNISFDYQLYYIYLFRISISNIYFEYLEYYIYLVRISTLIFPVRVVPPFFF